MKVGDRVEVVALTTCDERDTNLNIGDTGTIRMIAGISYYVMFDRHIEHTQANWKEEIWAYRMTANQLKEIKDGSFNFGNVLETVHEDEYEDIIIRIKSQKAIDNITIYFKEEK